MHIVFIGPPGSGKGTQAELLVSTYNMAHLSTGDMLRAALEAKTSLGLKAGQFIYAGHLAPDDIMIELIKERLKSPDCRPGYLLDGFPRTIAQAKALDEMLTAEGTPLDMALELKVPEDELFHRLASRRRADDKPEIIRERLVSYREQTAPLLAYYDERKVLKSIDGLGTVEDVFGRARGVLDKIARA